MPPLAKLIPSGTVTSVTSYATGTYGARILQRIYTTYTNCPQPTFHQTRSLENGVLESQHHVHSLAARDTRQVPTWEYWLWRVVLMVMFLWVLSAMCVGSYILGTKKRREEEDEKIEIIQLNQKHRLRSIGHDIPYSEQPEQKADKAYQRYKRMLIERLHRRKGERRRERKQKEEEKKKEKEEKKAEEKEEEEAKKEEEKKHTKDKQKKEANEEKDAEGKDSDTDEELKRKAEKVKKLKPLQTPIPWDNYDDPPILTMSDERDEFDTRIPMPRDRRQSNIDRARRQSIYIQEEDRVKKEEAKKRSSNVKFEPETRAKLESADPFESKKDSSGWGKFPKKQPPPWQWILDSEPWLRTVLRKAEVVNGIYHFTMPPEYPPPGWLEEALGFGGPPPPVDKDNPLKQVQSINWGRPRGRHYFLPDRPEFEMYEHPWDVYDGNINEVMVPLNIRAQMWAHEAHRMDRSISHCMDEQWKEIAQRKGVSPYEISETAPKPASQLPRPMKTGPAGLPLPDENTTQKAHQAEDEPISPLTVPEAGFFGPLQVDAPEKNDSEQESGQENVSPWKSRFDRIAKIFASRQSKIENAFPPGRTIYEMQQ